MAKRFIETGLLRKPLLRGLQGAYKTLFIYYITECDHAGIWNKLDMDIASMLIGEKFTIEGIEDAFGDELIDLGDKWFMPSFVEYQYGTLNPENRAHNSVIKILLKNNIDIENLKNKPHISPLQGAKDMDKDKELVKDKVKDKDKVKAKKSKTFITPKIESFLEHGKDLCRITNRDYNALEYSLRVKYKTWVDDGWKDGYGKQIKNWKNKLSSTLPHLKEIRNGKGITDDRSPEAVRAAFAKAEADHQRGL